MKTIELNIKKVETIEKLISESSFIIGMLNEKLCKSGNGFDLSQINGFQGQDFCKWLNVYSSELKSLIVNNK